jgi:Mu transposase-like protein
LTRFDTIERAALFPLPSSPYALAVWKQAKLHPDCHVIFEHAFYSAPYRLIGQRLWIRAADTSVQIFHQHELVATHSRAVRRGQRCMHADHLPPAKVAGLLATPAACLRRADDIGPATSEVIGRLLGDRGTLRKAWAFVMTLSFSRHCYVEFVFDQEVATWLRCHRHAFEWFSGVVRRVVIDNLKAAIVKAALYDPVFVSASWVVSSGPDAGTNSRAHRAMPTMNTGI